MDAPKRVLFVLIYDLLYVQSRSLYLTKNQKNKLDINITRSYAVLNIIPETDEKIPCVLLT